MRCSLRPQDSDNAPSAQRSDVVRGEVSFAKQLYNTGRFKMELYDLTGISLGRALDLPP